MLLVEITTQVHLGGTFPTTHHTCWYEWNVTKHNYSIRSNWISFENNKQFKYCVKINQKRKVLSLPFWKYASFSVAPPHRILTRQNADKISSCSVKVRPFRKKCTKWNDCSGVCVFNPSCPRPTSCCSRPSSPTASWSRRWEKRMLRSARWGSVSPLSRTTSGASPATHAWTYACVFQWKLHSFCDLLFTCRISPFPGRLGFIFISHLLSLSIW